MSQEMPQSILRHKYSLLVRVMDRLCCVQISALPAGGLGGNVTVEYNFTMEVLGKFVQKKKGRFSCIDCS